MATPKFDSIAAAFLKRIPDEFQSTFTPGTMVIPSGYIIPAANIVDYINRGMLKLFNDKWNLAFTYANGNPSIQIKYFISLLPELVKLTDVPLTDSFYEIASPLMDLFTIVGGLTTSDKRFVKVWDESKLLFALAGTYQEYTALSSSPAIIKVEDKIFYFPQDDEEISYQLQYIALPLNPETGDLLSQNGTYDIPFTLHWLNEIVNNAYQLYIEESQETV